MKTSELHSSSSAERHAPVSLPAHPAPNRPPTSAFALTISQAAALGLLAVVFFYYSALVPLAHGKIWSDLQYGEWMIENQAWPECELFAPYSDPEQPYVVFQWLSQITFYLVFHAGSLLGSDELSRLAWGVAMLRVLYGVLMVLKFGFVMLALLRSARSWPLAVVGGAVLVLVSLTSSRVEGAQSFGEVFFAFLLWWMSGPRLSAWTFVVIPLLFVAWANFHLSFVVGLGFLIVYWLGRMLEFALSRSARQKMGSWRGSWLWQGLAAVVLAPLAASFLNPEGPEIYELAVEMAMHPNVRVFPEWGQMAFTIYAGEHWNYSICFLLLVLSQALSPRALPLSRCIVLVPFAILAPSLLGAATWWLMLTPWLAVVLWHNSAAVLPRFWLVFRTQASVKYTCVAAVLLVASLLASFAWVLPIDKPTSDLNGSVSSLTLWELAEQLKHGKGMPALDAGLTEYPQYRFRGQMLVQPYLADYLLWRMPGAPVLLSSQGPYFSQKHWRDQMDVFNVKAVTKEEPKWPGWQEFLASKQVNMVVFDALDYPNLAKELRMNGDWFIICDEEMTSEETCCPLVDCGKLLIALRRQPL